MIVLCVKMIKTSAANRILNQAKKYMTICQIKILWNHCAHSQGRVLEGGIGSIAPVKPTKVTLFTIILYDSKNSFCDLKPFCRLWFLSR